VEELVRLDEGLFVRAGSAWRRLHLSLDALLALSVDDIRRRVESAEAVDPPRLVLEAVDPFPLLFRARQRWLWRHILLPHPELHVHIPPKAVRHFHIPPEAHNISMELNQFLVNSGNGTALQAGEGSVAAEERMEEALVEKQKVIMVFF